MVSTAPVDYVCVTTTETNPAESNSKCCSGSREKPGVVLAPDLAALKTSYGINPTIPMAETAHDDPVFGEEVGAANVF